MALLVKGLALFFTNLLVVLVGEPMIQWAFFKATKWLAQKTKTTVDDEFLVKLEDSYNKRNGR